jgi:DNA-binding GntR family transcriptional regulator
MSAPTSEKISRRPLYAEALRSIREAILRGDIPPGTRLYELELARRLDLSRGPVREALRQLEQEGIVVSSPHLGASVVSIDAAEIEDATSIRTFLETLHSDATIERLTDADLADLAACVEQIREASRSSDAALISETDFGFHERLLRIAGSPIVQQVWRMLAGRLRMSLALSNVIYLREVGDVAETHRPVMEALEARDAAQLDTALTAHIEESRTILRRLLDSRESPPTPNGKDE